jgi:hypothetical protein
METKRWEPVELEIWRGSEGGEKKAGAAAFDEQYDLIKRERLPDGRVKLILKDRSSGDVVQRFEE